MGSNEKLPLTPLAQEALDALAREFPAAEEVSYEQAYSILEKEVELNRPGATDIVERLYNKGYLYEVKGKLRLTDYESTQ
ncbi:hypothetical protein [Haladaptatus caseinilyticus]|uniref:hypothetical protein n=1 Tax=Haladaptatus caseinilyticus TaxID=2993314 RepID=UPI00224AFF5D|nr:hypothetical protein [Haladaptatus caseinilyticus]